MASEKNSTIFTKLTELSCQENGAKVLFATDDWFAAAENLLKSDEPVWREGFTEFGKWMDGWETRRKRIPGHDWCIIRLGVPGKIFGLEIDTAFFTGNNAPRFSLQGFESKNFEIDEKFPRRDPSIGKAATNDELAQVEKLNTENWEVLVPMTPLGSGYPETRHNFFQINSDKVITHLRLNSFPDGGIARIRAYGVVAQVDNPSLLVHYSQADFESESNFVKLGFTFTDPLVDLMAMQNGSLCLDFSDAHYGHPRNLSRPGRGKDMGDGWETARRLDRPPILKSSQDDPNILEFIGSEFAIFKLGVHGIIHMIEIDTNHFKGNYPDSVSIEGALIEDPEPSVDALRSAETWRVKVLPPQKLGPHARFFYSNEIFHHDKLSHVRITMKPDGGISRIRLLGSV